MQVINGILVDEMGVPIGSAPTPFGPMSPAMGQPQAAPPAQPPAPVAPPPAQPMAPPAPAPAPVSGDLIPASDEPFDITQAEGYLDPKRALWGGILMDIGNFIGSAGQRPMQGLGPAFMMNAMESNRAIQNRAADQRYRQEKLDLERQALAIETGKPEEANKVQSSFEGQNGNRWVIYKDGSVKDTGVAFASGFQYFPQEDGSVMAVNKLSGMPVGYSVTPGQAEAANRRAATLTKNIEDMQNLPLDEQAALTRTEAMGNTIARIDEALEMVSPWTTGVAGVAGQSVPGTQAYALARTVETVKANIGFDRLQRMRDESKTGGALGQVAIQELNALQNSIDSLDIGLPAAQLTQGLQNVRRQYTRAIDAYDKAMQAKRERLGLPADGGGDSGGWSGEEVP